MHVAMLIMKEYYLNWKYNWLVMNLLYFYLHSLCWRYQDENMTFSQTYRSNKIDFTVSYLDYQSGTYSSKVTSMTFGGMNLDC